MPIPPSDVDQSVLMVQDEPDINNHTAGDFIVDAISGIPAPIRKNALKAFAQLCTAVIDVPIAHLEGIAAEKRAETKARIALISESGRQISEQLNVDESFVSAASHKFSQKVVREQFNVQRISKVASDDLKYSLEADEVPSPEVEISDDWLNFFEREASTKSSEEMQFLFGKILAGEIRQPSSFSIRTVRLLGQLDAHVAKIFADVCSMTISLSSNEKIVDARVATYGMSKEEDPLGPWGISYSKLLLLQEYGLIVSEMKTQMDYTYSICQEGKKVYPFSFQGKKWVLEPTAERESSKKLWLIGPSLSAAGKELLKVVDIVPHAKYCASFKGFLIVNGLSMREID
ncbi:DUF2806 domain-containing protein [Pseudomonas siliginis]|uniref:DUF2806 domain-containing protein n=1 Tax=Pseudomonas siliginis TaxID=2842346 RepID=UPI003C2DE0B5